MQNPACGCMVSHYSVISKTKQPLVFLSHYTQNWKGTVVSRSAFLFKQSSPKVTEADTVKGILRHFWVSWENELGTVQASKGSSPLVFSVFGVGIEGKDLGGSGSLGRWGLSSLVTVEVCVPLGMRAGKGCFSHFRLPVSRKSVLWLWDCSLALG